METLRYIIKLIQLKGGLGLREKREVILDMVAFVISELKMKSTLNVSEVARKISETEGSLEVNVSGDQQPNKKDTA